MHRSSRPTSTVTSAAAVAVAALAAGALQIAVGVVQAVDPGDTIATLRPVEHLVLGLYAASLLLLVPVHLRLGQGSRARRSPVVAGVGLVVLAAGMTVTNLNDQDPSWFPVVAGAANAAWLLGSIALAVSLWRAGRVARWTAVLPVVTWVCGIPLSQLGGSALAGAGWLAVGALLRADVLERREVARPRVPAGA